MRLRELGLTIGTHPTGPGNALTDVAGVRVGHATISDSDAGIHTGVTMISPTDAIWTTPIFAGLHRLNGSGEVTGAQWLAETGELTTPIALTNTHSLGVVRDEMVAMQVDERGPGHYWSLPVVAETYDGVLNDINGHHVTAAHVRQARGALKAGPVAEGNVGGGTGMICHGFKGGIGTSSRVTAHAGGQYTVGVLVQANHGRRERLRVDGVPVGERIPASSVPVPQVPPAFEPGSGSIVAVVATDAPLLPHQCTRLAQRAGLGVARVGGVGEQYSGDLMIAFSTANPGLPPYGWDEDHRTDRPEIAVRMVAPQMMTRLFDLVVEATEEAIVGAMLAAESVTGTNGVTAHALTGDLLREAMAADPPTIRVSPEAQGSTP